MDIAALLAAVFDPQILLTILIATLYGSFVGAMPGLTATMAVALLVPFTYFMDPVQAVAAIVATTTTAIFAGDISGALLRMPGTPASAAYVEDSYALARGGEARTTLFVSLFSACIGGVVGVLILATATPLLAAIASNFSSDEAFWLATLGLSCAVLVGGPSVPRNFASLFIGLAIATVGIDVAVGHPRFTFGLQDLYGGISFIPAMIGLFAISELLREAGTRPDLSLGKLVIEPLGTAIRNATRRMRANWRGIGRSSVGGTLIGALPGAGADIAAWIAYAVARRVSKTPEKFGTGHYEGIVNAGAANNAGVAGAWTPALVFGIPGDSVTAIAIGVMLMKGLTPGPNIFESDGLLIQTLFGAFLLANIVMLFTGGLAVAVASWILRVPRAILMPSVLLLSMVGAFAIDGSVTSLWITLVLGVLGFAMVRADIPIAPAVLGVVLGEVVEDNFMVSMMKAQGDLTGFFSRTPAAVLGTITLIVWAALLWRSGRELVRAFRTDDTARNANP
ncbi:tripartite tricarboxylate transporter permease [Oceaniglobus roseus]|uniref:tripartite tricarboxylate transporter permease n=1 Tax=Oceaniglobus roseus TaxID=1737570 RepID=UPI000C7F352A|nr:tripartite tricarboxylate transporter permease [Kandeliimicrobium roseum]